jgi:hypothetical protein
MKMMSILDVFHEQADKILSHLGIKVRYSVQAQAKNGTWYDLNQSWDNATKAKYSVTRTVADARHWAKRYDAAMKKQGMQSATRIVRQVTQFDVVA